MDLDKLEAHAKHSDMGPYSAQFVELIALIRKQEAALQAATTQEIRAVASKAQFMAENLRKGEIYAGLLLGKGDEPDTHIFLMDGKVEKVNWDQAREWAAKIGGDLPTRREQSLLFANLKEQFAPAYYWSNEQHADGSDYAWFQSFNDGFHGNYNKSYSCRARAVRRLIIQ